MPVFPATGADHAAIYFFLNQVFNGPSRTEFHASLADPFCEPQDRLLLRREGRILAHAHLTHRVMQFGRVQIPVAGLDGLGVVDDERGRGLGTHLLQAAEKRVADLGAMVGLLRTRIPHFFRRTGWALCGRHSLCEARTHAVLGRLVERGLRPGRRARLHIRPWRQWEEGALVRIYRQNLAGSHGPLERTLAYWRWLLRRHAYDHLYVALEGPDQLDLTEATTRIVGYAAIRGDRIVELITNPGRRRVAAELLARACGDAVERNQLTIGLHAPQDSPMVELLDEAGGWRHEGEAFQGEVFMARVLDPLGLLHLLCDEFHRRALAAGLNLHRPVGLGLMVERQKYQIEIARTGATASASQVGRSYLAMNVADFTRLLLGQFNWHRAEAEGRVVPSTILAGEMGRVLFPSLPMWRPPLDELTALDRQD
jgi:N-acetylglutamate synthase-like GNAT family acetyltransferase